MISELALLAQAAAPLFNAKFAVAIAGFGAAIGVGLVGWGATNAIGRNPGAFGKILVMGILGMAFAEAIAFYALFLGQ
ncbi:MAG: ATP synthase F0 subunit C [Verrucomicrobia bacterium]|jgi:F-type H+-transporting ATPase subunit c|nr:ATP synthase F0 subunit C [Verrucomicrobiota bacterium]